MKRAQVKAQNTRSVRGIYNQATPPEFGDVPGKVGWNHGPSPFGPATAWRVAVRSG